MVFAGTTIADHDFIFAGDDPHRVRLRIPALETAAGQVDTDGLRLAGFERHLTVGAERLQGTLAVGGVADIHLYGLGAFFGAGIRDAHLYLIILISWLADLESRVTQTVAEGEERLTGEVAVSAVLH